MMVMLLLIMSIVVMLIVSHERDEDVGTNQFQDVQEDVCTLRCIAPTQWTDIMDNPPNRHGRGGGLIWGKMKTSFGKAWSHL